MSAQPYHPEAEIGRPVYASSEGDGHPDVGVLLRLSETDFLWCGEITRAEAEAAGINDAGWHLVHHHSEGSRVVAQVADSYAGVDFVEALAGILLSRAGAVA